MLEHRPIGMGVNVCGEKTRESAAGMGQPSYARHVTARLLLVLTSSHDRRSSLNWPR
jgi:hypothetical protein